MRASEDRVFKSSASGTRADTGPAAGQRLAAPCHVKVIAPGGTVNSDGGVPMSEAILVTDMLAEFVHGRLGNDRCRSIVPALQGLLTAARESNHPIVYVCDSHLPTDPELRIW